MTEQIKKVTWRPVGPIGSWELTPVDLQTTLPEIKSSTRHVWDLCRVLPPLPVKKSASEERFSESDHWKVSTRTVQMLVGVLGKQTRQSLRKDPEYGKSGILNHWKGPNIPNLSNDYPANPTKKLRKPLQISLKSSLSSPHFPLRSISTSTRFSSLPKSFVLAHSHSDLHKSSIKLTYRFC